jgi:hypothetical protein
MAFAFNLNLRVFSARGRLVPRGELTMSWISDEANKNVNTESKEARRQEVLRTSNYWAALVRQLEHDVNTINEHDYWKTKLAGFPLTFGTPYGGEGYQISKSGFPSILIEIQNRGSYIEIGRRYTENPLSNDREFPGNERLAVDVSGNVVVLRNKSDQTFVVPADASQYILRAVIESLKITKSS